MSDPMKLSSASKVNQVDADLRKLDYDPDLDIYLERARRIRAKAKGLERLAYEIFGTELIAKAALALDVSKRFRYVSSTVSPVTRWRYYPGVAYSKRYGFRTQVNKTTSTIIGRNLYAPLSGVTEYESTVDDRQIVLTPQYAYQGRIGDTTVKTRGKDQTQGEFYLFLPTLKSLPFSIDRSMSRRTTVYEDPDLTNKQYYREQVHYGISSPSVYIDSADLRTFEADYNDYATSILMDRAPDLLSNCLPNHRRYNLAYNIAELRELPALLRQTLHFYRDIFGKTKNISSLGDLYLAYKFGWESTVKSVQSMLRLPERISKDVNRLISRAGKPTTYSYRIRLGTRKLALNPSFSTETFSIFDEYPSMSELLTQTWDSAELRAAVNCNVILPHVEIPSTERLSLTLRKYGADLNPADLYNLIPWTWLGDWFSDVSQYLKMIEAISFDPSTFNYALMSYVSTGHSLGQFIGVTEDRGSYTSIPPLYVEDRISKLTVTREARLDFRFHIRKDAASILDGVKSTANGSTLTPYQKSILAALASKYKGKVSAPSKTTRLNLRGLFS